MGGRPAGAGPGGAGPRVAVDAMGGDAAPGVAVAGALRARDEHGVDIVLVGAVDAVRDALVDAGAAPEALPVAVAEEAVGMDEDPALAVRTKRGASIRVAMRLLAASAADAVVSAGSTGATLAASLVDLGRLPGVRRPALAVAIPLRGGDAVVLVDAGATADVGPEVLPGYARMGAAYAAVRAAGSGRAAATAAAPRIGLLNVGAELGKGNAMTRAARERLGAVAGFVGNVEPAAVLDGAVDVVVADGFTGNVFLKTLEAAGGHREEAARAGSAAVLLGVAGEVLVTHGAATASEVAGAVSAAAVAGRAGLSLRVAERLADGRDAGPADDQEGRREWTETPPWA